MESIAIVANAKAARSKKPDSTPMVEAVLKASHLSLIVGSKQVQQTEVQGAGNPNGVGMQRRLKEKAVKVVLNKLEAGPVNLKAIAAWNGMPLGTGSAAKENVVSKTKAQLSKAQLVASHILNNTGSG